MLISFFSSLWFIIQQTEVFRSTGGVSLHEHKLCSCFTLKVFPQLTSWLAEKDHKAVFKVRLCQNPQKQMFDCVTSGESDASVWLIQWSQRFGSSHTSTQTCPPPQKKKQQQHWYRLLLGWCATTNPLSMESFGVTLVRCRKTHQRRRNLEEKVCWGSRLEKQFENSF